MRARSLTRSFVIGGFGLALLVGTGCQDESGASDGADPSSSPAERLDAFCEQSGALSAIEVDPAAPDPGAAQAVLDTFGDVVAPEEIRADVETLAEATEAALAAAPGTDGRPPEADQMASYVDALERIETSSARIDDFVVANC